MNLESENVLVNELDVSCIEQMQELMHAHYEGVSKIQFRADLANKKWAILLRNHGKLCGFSTQVLFDHLLDGRPVKILFSGDTIIEKAHWGSMALPIAWGRLMLSLCAAHPETELYWLLTSKGYKTYRFLPVFFQEFHPSCKNQTLPFEKALLESVATRQFGKRFNSSTGTLRAETGAQRLREGIAELDESRLRDPHVAFFQLKNPGHVRGDELVCLARFCRENLRPYILRQL